jgi:hypothetical protein
MILVADVPRFERSRSAKGGMNMHYRHLDVAEHVEIGNTLKFMRQAMHTLTTICDPSSKAAQEAALILERMDQLANSLTTKLCETVPPTRDQRHLARRIHHGSVRFRMRHYNLNDLMSDAFAAWEPICEARRPSPCDQDQIDFRLF